MGALDATVIIPFHRDLRQLALSLPAARRGLPTAEILVAADGATEDWGPLARASAARVIEVEGPSGPATARNRAAAQATGDVLIFVDADVVVADGALAGMCELLRSNPDISAVFGAYDLEPAQPNFMSQYKNLSHACIHESGDPEARTFWAGLGAVRADAYRRVGGFDERFRRPSIEDIELGYRLRQAGYRIRLDPTFRGKHLKLWTWRNSIITDIKARGIPWTQLIHRFGALANDLNLRWESRLSVVLAYLVAATLVAAPFVPWMLWLTTTALLVFVLINRQYLAWFRKHRGLWFSVQVVPALVVHHLCNGVSFAAGTAIHLGSRLGVRLPGAIPDANWNGGK